MSNSKSCVGLNSRILFVHTTFLIVDKLSLATASDLLTRLSQFYFQLIQPPTPPRKNYFSATANLVRIVENFRLPQHKLANQNPIGSQLKPVWAWKSSTLACLCKNFFFWAKKCHYVIFLGFCSFSGAQNDRHNLKVLTQK